MTSAILALSSISFPDPMSLDSALTTNLQISAMNASDQITQAPEQYLQYRAVSLSAVTTLILGIISLPALLFSKLLILPAIGLLVGVYSVIHLGRRRHEFVGLNMARIGLALSALVLLGGSAYTGYVFATEVPDGYTRISFEALQPDVNHPQMPIPPAALELNGKRVFVKGYVHPGVDRRSGIKQFVLVPDMKTCCFGGQPKLTDMIEVTLQDPQRISYSFARRKLAGVLRVTPYKKQVAGLDGVYYQLDAEYVR
jgi:hypothetical protein